MRHLALIAAAAASIAFATPADAQNGDRQLLTISCSGCHGTGGHSAGAIPSLYGRTAASIADSLRAFRDGKQPATVMDRIAKGYTDAEIDMVAREIASNWKN
jgi:sulfide dehydrogenase cytochrome subunit